LFGVGFVVSPELKHLVIGFTPISSRLAILRIKGRFFNYSIVNGHAPTEDSYDACPKNDIKIVLGDFNAQLGKEVMYLPAIGMHSNTNDNRSRLISFTALGNLIVGSTLYPHR
jgi:hypothetical protein